VENWKRVVLWVIVAVLLSSMAACAKKMEKEGITEMSEQINQSSNVAGELYVGGAAPECSAPATDGRNIRLSDLKGSWVVLYFYPKAFTGG
jgi:cytochrome oxidase Cu insertion factor (SCO1/SenC/PrrC family)